MVRMIRRSTLVTSGRVEDATIKTVDLGTDVLRVLRYSFLGTAAITGPKEAWHTFPGMSTGTLVWGRPEGGSVDIEAYAQGGLKVSRGILYMNMDIAGTWPLYLVDDTGTALMSQTWSWRKKVGAGSLAVKARVYADGTVYTGYHRSFQVYELKRRS